MVSILIERIEKGFGKLKDFKLLQLKISPFSGAVHH